MILTCPECATSYFVDDLRIPRLGRMVKCTNCGHRWRAHQDRTEPEVERPSEEMVDGAPPPSAPIEDDIEFVAPVEPVRKKPERKKPRGLMIAVSGAVVVLAVAAGAAVLLRQQIAGMFPGTAPLFSAIGLPVNTIGLVLEGVKSQPMLQGGRPVWSVTGAVRNVRDEAIAAPPIRLALLNAEGEEVATLVADALNARVPPGAVRYFAITMPDPPSGAEKLEVRFEFPAEGAAHAPVAAAVAPAPAATAPVEAQPLPPDSPDALEKHEQH